MRFDIFCHIVDHLGDAGVCLRLVRRLALTHFTSDDHFTSSDKDSLRLFCDQPELIKKLAGEDMLRELITHGVEILPWESAAQSLNAEIFPDVVIETFSCELPTEYLAQLKYPHPTDHQCGIFKCRVLDTGSAWSSISTKSCG